jgi:hypothetical protein
LAALALAFSAVVFCSEEARAQRDLRVPGRTGVKTRPNMSPSDKEKSGETGAPTDSTPADPLARFQGAPAALNSDDAALRSEFAAARSIYSKLKPEQFVAARLLAQFAADVPGVNLTAQDLFRGLANKKGFRTTLKNKGLTGGQVDSLMQRLAEKMSELMR